MNVTMDDCIKRWRATRKAAAVVESFRVRRRWRRPVGLMTFHLRRSRAGSMTPSGAWRMPSVRTRLRFASNIRSNWRTCRRPTARPCWSCATEKSWRPSWSGTEWGASAPPARARLRTIDPDAPWGPPGGWGLDAANQALHLVRRTPADGL